MDTNVKAYVIQELKEQERQFETQLYKLKKEIAERERQQLYDNNPVNAERLQQYVTDQINQGDADNEREVLIDLARTLQELDSGEDSAETVADWYLNGVKGLNNMTIEELRKECLDAAELWGYFGEWEN